MRSVLTLCLLFVAAVGSAQTFNGRVTDADGRPLEAVSVVAADSASHTLGFGYTAKDGSFAVKADGAAQLSFSMMGFERLVIAAADFRSGQTIRLTSKSFVLKEVKVRPDKITQTGDTLTYNVAQFRQGQDRSIADVIKNMPGLEVSESGQISFEGKPINRFYVEGMDLMGGKYAQASENLQAKNVESVQVLQNHQPVKSLRGVQFSEQAALNIVLKDEARNTWAKTADLGVGASRQDFLYDGRLMAMMFGRKHQNLSMYKAANNGKDIVHEVGTIASFMTEKQEMEPLLRNISVTAPDLDHERTNFSTAHTVATNELFRTRRGNDLRIQADWLWMRERADFFHETEYADLGGVLLSEATSVTSIANRLNANLTYKANKENFYLCNQLHGYADFDRSRGSTIIDGRTIRQSVMPRKRSATEHFELTNTFAHGSILSFSSLTTYTRLPGQILTILGSTEQLDLSGVESCNTIALRQRAGALALGCEAGVNLKSQRLAMAPARTFSCELRSRLNGSRQVQKGGSGQGSTVASSLACFNHTLSLFFFPHSKWEIAVENSLFHSSDEAVSLTHFADAHIAYKQKRYELRFVAANLLGHDTFARRTIGTATHLYSIYSLRPREFLLSASIDL